MKILRFTSALGFFIIPTLAFAQDGMGWVTPTSMIASGALNTAVTLATNDAVYGTNCFRVSCMKSPTQSSPNQSAAKLQQPPAQVASLFYGTSAPLSRIVQSEFLARVRQGNPAAAQQVAAQFAQYNPSEIFARFAKAAGVPFRDPSSSMAIYTVIGWGIVNNKYPDPNDATDMARVRAVRSQMIPLIGSLPNMAKPEMRQRLDEELMILSVLLDAANTSATTREGPDARAKLSDGVHAMWLKQFGKDLRKLALTDQGLVKR